MNYSYICVGRFLNWLMESFIIAIDGFSSTGKSTFAKLIADKLGFVYVDSGAIYRLVSLYSLQSGLIKDGTVDIDALSSALPSIQVSYEISDNKSQICLNGVNVEKRIRLIDVAECVSQVSAIPFVREWVNQKLRSSVEGMNVVMDGRDIGTTVFPDAQLKIYMVADARIRAQRRMLQLEAAGEQPVFEDIYSNIVERDYIDSHRKVSPLRKADDAIVLDNSHMTMNQQMDWILSILKDKFNKSFDEA